jgi:hypothetical protein
VEVLSTIWHVNVVKLLCSVSRSDDGASLLLFEHLLNGSLYEYLDAQGIIENVLMMLKSVELLIAIAPKASTRRYSCWCLMTNNSSRDYLGRWFGGHRRMQNLMVNVETTIYTGSVRQNSVLRPMWVEYYIALCAWGLDHEVWSSADLGSPTLLYIVQGA